MTFFNQHAIPFNRIYQQKCKTGSNRSYFDQGIFNSINFDSLKKQTSFFFLSFSHSFFTSPVFFDMSNSSKKLWDEQWKYEREIICYFIPPQKDHLLLKREFVTVFVRTHTATCQKFPSSKFTKSFSICSIWFFNSECLGTLSGFRKSFWWQKTFLWKGFGIRQVKSFVAKRWEEVYYAIKDFSCTILWVKDFAVFCCLFWGRIIIIGVVFFYNPQTDEARKTKKVVLLFYGLEICPLKKGSILLLYWSTDKTKEKDVYFVLKTTKLVIVRIVVEFIGK